MNEDQNLLLDNFDNAEAYNDYYASVSVFFRIASFIFLITFLLFIVYSAFSNQKVFNYDNFDYIVRNFALTLEEKNSDTLYSIRYNPDSCRSFTTIGDKFAICGNSGISVYSPTGRLIYSESLSLKNPTMISSDKYAMIYDSGNCDYVVFNSFAKVLSQSTAKPIRGACMAPNGSFALITSSDEYNSIVEVYNENFKMINRFSKSGYVINIDMTNDKIIITTVHQSDAYGLYDLQIHLYNLSNSETIFTDTFESSLPISCNLTSNGFVLVCSDEAIIYDVDKDKSKVYSYNGSEVVDLDYMNDTIALVLDNHSNVNSYRILAIKSSLEVLYDYSIDSKVYDIKVCDNILCLLTDDRIIISNASTSNEIAIDEIKNDCSLLIQDNNTLYLCTNSSAQIIKLKQ